MSQTKNIHIVHVIVVYENYADTHKLLNAICKQREDIHTVVLIDNTEYNIEGVKLLHQKWNTNINLHYFKTKRNVGSSCGFSLGMYVALKLGAEYVWLHDQDGYPYDDCLEKMTKYLIHSSYDILSPYLVDENNNYIPALHGIYDKYWNLCTLQFEHTPTLTDVAASAGLFIHRRVLQELGFYDYEHFFHGYEDFDFCLRAKSAGFQSFVIRNAYYFHPNKWITLQRSTAKRFVTYYGDISSSVEKFQLQQSHIYYFVYHNTNNPFLSLIFTVLKSIYKKIVSPRSVLLSKTLRVIAKAYLDKRKQRKYFFTEKQFHDFIERENHSYHLKTL